jgi:hypothetical protein
LATTKIQVRRGTAAQWASANPVLSDGEVAFERDTNKIKIGDGLKSWSALSYLVSDSAGGITSVTIADLPPGGMIVVDKAKAFYGAAGVWPSSRPTSRTDICVLWLGDTDPGTIAIAGDIVDLVG